jgi:hypothetical protein
MLKEYTLSVWNWVADSIPDSVSVAELLLAPELLDEVSEDPKEMLVISNKREEPSISLKKLFSEL